MRGRRREFQPSLKYDGGWDDELGEGDAFRPAAEELGEEFLCLLAHAVLVDAGAEVGFRAAEGGGEVEGREGGRTGRFREFGGLEDFEEGRGERDVG